jgi:nostrin
MLRGSSMIQSLENQRMSHLKTYAGNYLKLTTEMNPVYEEIVERLAPQVNKCDIQKDMSGDRGTG